MAALDTLAATCAQKSTLRRHSLAQARYPSTTFSQPPMTRHPSRDEDGKNRVRELFPHTKSARLLTLQSVRADEYCNPPSTC